MTRAELEHAIRAACDVAQDNELIIFGSQAILGQYPDAPAALRQSAEADVSPRNAIDRIDLIDGALGEDSQFHQTHRFYVHGVPVETAKLPDGWERRAIKVQNANTRHYIGWCPEAADLAASKLAAFREKDRDFVRVLLAERLVKSRTLVARIRRLAIGQSIRERLIEWVDRTARDLFGNGRRTARH